MNGIRFVLSYWVTCAVLGLSPSTAVAQGGFIEADADDNQQISAEELGRYVAGKVPGIDGRADVLLITSERLAPAWQEFARWKTQTGRPTKIVTVEQIDQQFEGADLQAKIRQCCLQHIDQHRTRWVILGGDSRGDGSSHVPDRDTHHSDFYRYEDIPTDIYYLSRGDWDANDDGVYGKFADDLEAVDYVHPNASLGRIPVRTAEDVAAYTRKVIAYESDYPVDDFAAKMIYTCPEAGAYPKLSTSKKTLEESWKPGNISQFFANRSPWDQEQPGDYDLTPANWVKMINQRQAAKIHMHGHGFLPLWVLEGQTRASLDTIGNLSNENAYPIITTVSCFTGHYDAPQDPAITESILRKSNGGAIAIIAPSREGIPVFHQSSDFKLMMTEGKMDGTTEFLTRFWAHALGSGGTIGDAFGAARVDMTPHAKRTIGYHFVQCELNLLGDPTLDVRAQPPRTIKGKLAVDTSAPQVSSITVTGVADCQVCLWDGGKDYQIKAADSEGKVVFEVSNQTSREISVAAYAPNRNIWTESVVLK
ncbi:MAG: C25 family cysteine peptidase [Pirellulales bacterium]|nr:C25 family cysteine peptidase [Pirellulales bacterium]